MAAAHRQPAHGGDPADWVSVDEASALSGEHPRTWRRRAAWEADQAIREHREPLAFQGSAGWRVHRSMDAKLTRYPAGDTRDGRDRPGLSARYPAHRVDRACRCARWMKRWRDLCNGRRGPRDTDLTFAESVVAEAHRTEGPDFRISVRTLQRWNRDYHRMGDAGRIIGVEALVPGYKAPQATRSPDAVEYFYSLYRCENRLGAALCHEVTAREAGKRGWTWPASVSATTKWLREHDERSVTYLLRNGKDKWARKFIRHIEVDYTAIEPADLYVCDHTKLDLVCTYRDEQIRPWLTAVQDGRSRCIVGWWIGPSPHQDAIVAAFRRAFRDWSIPKCMRIDNGADFSSERITGVTKTQRDALRRELGPDWRKVLRRNAAAEGEGVDPRWMGICGELDIELIYAIAYHPWAKGTIERFFGTVKERFSKTEPTYCGHSAATKPEALEDFRRGYTRDQARRLRKLHGADWKRHATLKLSDQTDVPTIEDVAARFAEWLDVYHRKAHRGDGMGGASPIAVWRTATRVHKATDTELALVLASSGEYSVTANGVHVKVGSTRIGYGARSSLLRPYVGRKVLVCVDPDRPAAAWAYTAEGEKRTLIGRIEPNEKLSPTADTQDVREAIAEVTRERRVMDQARRSSVKRTRTATQRVNEHAHEVRTELLATGTDDADPRPNIVPVRTSFEGASMPDRSVFEDDVIDDEELDASDLLDDESELVDAIDDVDDDGDDVSVLFMDDEPTDDDDDEGIGGLL